MWTRSEAPRCAPLGTYNRAPHRPPRTLSRPTPPPQLLEPGGAGGREAAGFEVSKSGDARVALIGFPSVGKSTLLTMLTGTQSAAASYEFTTLSCE